MNRRISMMIAVGLAVTGCGTIPQGHLSEPSKAHIPCNGGCEVDVVMVIQPDGRCAVSPLNDIQVSGRNVNILWKLVESSRDYTFAEDGVYIKPRADPDQQFSKVTEPGDGRKYIVHDRNSLTGDRYYPYTIQILDPAKHPCAPYDPWIINQG